MSDRRLTPSNGRVAALHLKGTVAAERFVAPEPRCVAVAVADLRATPDGPRERQLLRGETFLTLEFAGNMAFGYAKKDGYCGWIAAADLIGAPREAPTHRITVARSYGKSTPGLKAFGTVKPLSLGMDLTVLETAGGWSRIAWSRGTIPKDLFVPEGHLRPLDKSETDPAAVAERLIHTPYLWGGNSAFGIDCSGLVQMGCRLCGILCPGDSDLQQESLGETLPPGTPPPTRRPDVLEGPRRLGRGPRNAPARQCLPHGRGLRANHRSHPSASPNRATAPSPVTPASPDRQRNVSRHTQPHLPEADPVARHARLS